jgi:hypothetical protein
MWLDLGFALLTLGKVGERVAGGLARRTRQMV